MVGLALLKGLKKHVCRAIAVSHDCYMEFNRLGSNSLTC